MRCHAAVIAAARGQETWIQQRRGPPWTRRAARHRPGVRHRRAVALRLALRGGGRCALVSLRSRNSHRCGREQTLCMLGVIGAVPFQVSI